MMWAIEKVPENYMLGGASCHYIDVGDTIEYLQEFAPNRFADTTMAVADVPPPSR
jgi:hypothetical protein